MKNLTSDTLSSEVLNELDANVLKTMRFVESAVNNNLSTISFYYEGLENNNVLYRFSYTGNGKTAKQERESLLSLEIFAEEFGGKIINDKFFNYVIAFPIINE